MRCLGFDTGLRLDCWSSASAYEIQQEPRGLDRLEKSLSSSQTWSAKKCEPSARLTADWTTEDALPGSDIWSAEDVVLED
jgi:hypothetical protein